MATLMHPVLRLVLSIALLGTTASAGAQISLTAPNVPATENFDTLATTGTTNTTLPTGWAFLETGTGANTTYRAGDGSGNAGDTYSFGTGTSTERAFGQIRSGSLISTLGASLVNNTGVTITSLRIAYVGEQWRVGANMPPRQDRLDFQYSTDATGLGSGTWTDVNELDFLSPNPTAAVGALDGNLAINREALAHTITGLNIANGATFWIRWLDFDAPGADDGMAIDDVAITANPSGGGVSLSIGDVSLAEGNIPGDTTSFNFLVSLSSPAPAGGVRFDAISSDGTATLADNDYVAIDLEEVEIEEGESSTTVTVLVNHDLVGEYNETFLVTISNLQNATPGNLVGTGTILNDDPLEIFQIQGDGVTSPVVGSAVMTMDNVVTALAPNGFFMQTPAARDDNNLATSNGIFVFTGGAPSVAVGDRVNVEGNVQEFFDFTQISGNPIVVVTGTLPLPPPVILDPSFPSPLLTTPSCFNHPDPEVANFECIEGMRVSLLEGIANGPSQYFTSDPLAEPVIVAGNTRAFREPGILTPGYAGIASSIPIFDGNPEIFELDPDKLLLPNQAMTGGTRFAAEGVIGYDFGDFELWPTSLTILEAAPMPRPVDVPDPGNLTIGSINMLRIFDPDTGNNTVVTCLNSVPYTALTHPSDYPRRLAKLSSYIRHSLRTPDVVAVQEVENLGVLQDLADKIELDDPSVIYTAHLAGGNDVGGINNGYLVRSGRINPGFVVTQLGKNDLNTFDDPPSCLHDRPPYLLEGVFSVGNRPFAVLNNHTRSFNGVTDCRTAGERVCNKRKLQAESIAGYVQTFQTANPTIPLVLIGDYNAYQFTDGHVDTMGIIRGDAKLDGDPNPDSQLAPTADIVEPNLVDKLGTLAQNERYSYIFDNHLQVIDHAVVSAAADAVFVGLSYARGNVDEPLGFRRFPGSNREPILGDDLLSSSFERSNDWSPLNISDHDGLVIRLFP